MTSPFHLQAVIEAPYFQDKFICHWDVPPFKPFSWIRLSGEMTYPEIGLVFAQLVQYNKVDLSGESYTVLKQILETESLVLPGGIQAVWADKVISPSCCCGLETWRDWQEFLKTGETPWLGHDPSPWLEIRGDLIRIWSDGGLGESIKNAVYIEIERSAFRAGIQSAEKDLQAFLFCIGSWALEVGFEQSDELFQKFDQCFHIGRRYTVTPA
jgi:hypothetical protein